MKSRHAFQFVLTTVCGIVLASSVTVAEEPAKKMPPKVTYEDDVKPIFRQKCFSCHNPDKKSGDLDLTNYSSLMQGGGSGEVVEAGDSSGSYLYMLITHDSEPYMPPEQPKLPDEMIETVRKWIDGGVLETKSSTARIKKKKTFDLALQSAPTERPAVAPMPPRLSLEPVTRTEKTTAVASIATSPWSPLAAVAGQKQVLLYNTQTLQLVGTLAFPEGTPQVLKFSRNGSLLLAGGGQGGATGKAIVWNVQTGERVFEVGDELDAVLAADISSDQTLIALGGPQKIVRIYSTESGRLLHELRKHTDWVCSIEFSPDSVLLATGDRAGGLYVWEGWTGREYLTLKAHTACVTGVSWRTDSNIVASCSEDGSIRLWEMNNGAQVKSWGAHGGGAASVEFSRDGRILSCGRDKVAKLWDQNGAAQKQFEAFGDLALSVSFCDETNRAIAGDWTGAIRVWNAADGARVGELSPNPPKLAERLAAANATLAEKTAAQKPLVDAYMAAKAAADKARADLAAAQKAAADTKAALDAATAKTNAAKDAAAKAAQADADAKKATAELAAAVPALLEAATKAQEAASNMPDDKELAAMAAELKAKSDKGAADLEASKAAAAAAATALTAAQAAVVAAEKEVVAADAGYKAAVAQVATVTPLVKPAEDAANAAKQAADVATAAFNAAQAEVTRWTGEIAFTNQLVDLTTKRAAAVAVLTGHEDKQGELLDASAIAQSALGKSMADLKTYQDNVAAAQKQAESAQAELVAFKAADTAAEAARVATAAIAAKLEAVVPPLTQSAASAKDAATKSGNEKALVDAAAVLQTLLTAKQTALDAAKKDLVVKTAAAATAKQQVTAGEKKVVDATAALTAAQAKAAELAAAMKPVADAAAAAKAAADAAAKPVADAQKVVDDINAQIATLKGIKAA